MRGLRCQPQVCEFDLQGSEQGRVRVRAKVGSGEGREEAGIGTGLGPWGCSKQSVGGGPFGNRLEGNWD